MTAMRVLTVKTVRNCWLKERCHVRSKRVLPCMWCSLIIALRLPRMIAYIVLVLAEFIRRALSHPGVDLIKHARHGRQRLHHGKQSLMHALTCLSSPSCLSY
jgi:hypothetical protein